MGDKKNKRRKLKKMKNKRKEKKEWKSGRRMDNTKIQRRKMAR